METVIKRCCGLDVHKKTVVACVRVEETPGRVHRMVKTFETTTSSLLKLGDWLRLERVEVVAMEATGVLWKPVWNLLEGNFDLLLANAHHIKKLPGRKTDVKDSEWIAELLAHGLLPASFVPPAPLRELRDLTRMRVNHSDEAVRLYNRMEKTLETCNIKLGSVASDLLGKSGRDMIAAIVAGTTDPAVLAELACGRLRGKIPQLREALTGRVTEHHRFMLGMYLQQWDFLAKRIEEVEERIERLMLPFKDEIERLTSIPGVGRIVAWTLVAEMGDMTAFPTPPQAASWAGVCPGNHESAGKRQSGRTPKGDVWVRRALNQAAWAASRTKDTYLAAQFRRIASRRGGKRAAVAVGHTILVISWHLLHRKRTYHDLGGDFFDKLNSERTTKRLVKRLETLGHTVTLTDAA